YFGRVNLSWSGKYLFEFNYRQDGSSRFDKNNRWGGFPSISAGWNISEEPFMASMKQTWLDNLKLRASWGSLGNNSVGNYATIPTMSQALYVLNGNPVNGFVSSLVNGNLKWESTYVTNIGLDFIIKNRLNGSIDFYNKLTKNILSQLPIPLENGLVDAPYQNSAKVRNRGLEVNLGWQDKICMVNYFVKGNFTYNENKVIKFKGSERSINGTTMIQEGYGINTQYVRKVNRIIQTDADVALVQDIINKAPEGKNPFPNGVPVKGDLLYKDMNKDGLINDDDRVPVGHGANPRFMYGLSFGVNWKGLDFSCQMDGIAGIKAYYNNNFYTVSLGEPQIINKKIADGRWYEGRTDAKFPRLTNKSITKNVLNSDFWIKNNSFIKVRNIQLGYTIPSFITQKVNISRLRLYTSLENFFTITNYPGLDPEVAGMNYPQMKQAVLGINLSF
ncbi:MAG: SusC/RagA family TonB-linked outer membrane protein, partial [Bacteroidaceae bacterium]